MGRRERQWNYVGGVQILVARHGCTCQPMFFIHETNDVIFQQRSDVQVLWRLWRLWPVAYDNVQIAVCKGFFKIVFWPQLMHQPLRIGSAVSQGLDHTVLKNACQIIGTTNLESLLGGGGHKLLTGKQQFADLMQSDAGRREHLYAARLRTNKSS